MIEIEDYDKRKPIRSIERKGWVPGALVGTYGDIYEPCDKFEIEVADEVRKIILVMLTSYK